MALELHPPLDSRTERLGKGTLWTYAPIVCVPFMEAPHLKGAKRTAETKRLERHVRLMQQFHEKFIDKPKYLALIADLPIDRMVTYDSRQGLGLLVATRGGTVYYLLPHYRDFPTSIVYEADALSIYTRATEV